MRGFKCFVELSYKRLIDLPVIGVPSCMIFAVCKSAETFTASMWTFVGLLSAMDSHMDFQVRLLSERAPTARVITLELLHASVPYYVIFERVLAGKGFSTTIERTNMLKWFILDIYDTI